MLDQDCPLPRSSSLSALPSHNTKMTDTDIIKKFYTWLKELQEGREISHKAESEKKPPKLTPHYRLNALCNRLEDIEAFWELYTIGLPTNVKKLKRFVVSQPQQLPEQFDYIDILKAVFAIAIPDILLQQYTGITLRGNRPDYLFNLIRYEEKENSYELHAVLANDAKQKEIKESFSRFVAQHEQSFGKKSRLHKFKQYLDAHPVLDKYTQHDFSLLFLDEVVYVISTLFQSYKPIENLIDINRCIMSLHAVCAEWLNDYMTKRKNSILDCLKIFSKKKPPSLPPPHIRQREYHVEKTSHINTVLIFNSHSSYPFADTLSGGLDQYIQYTRWIISLGISPAITKEDKSLLNAAYSAEVSLRKAVSSEEDEEGLRLSLGLEENEDYSKLICDDYSFPKDAFTLLKDDKNFLSHNDLLTYFFKINISFLRQIDSTRCDPTIYHSIIKRLWNAFIDDGEFPQHLIEHSKTICLATTFPVLSADFINKIATHPSPLLERVIEALFTTNFMLPIHSVTENDEHYQEYIVLYLLEEAKKLPSLEFKSKVTTVLECHQLSSLQKLALVGTITQDTNINKRSNFRNIHKLDQLLKFDEWTASERPQKIKACITRAIGKNTLAFITSAAINTELSTLTAWYLNAKSQQKFTLVLTKCIENLYPKYELNTLRNSLSFFALEEALLEPMKTSQSCYSSFFSLKKTLTSLEKKKNLKPIAKIIHMIDNEKMSTAEILGNLKRIAETQTPSNSNIKNLYKVIQQFFSPANKKSSTRKNLVRAIEKIIPQTRSELRINSLEITSSDPELSSRYVSQENELTRLQNILKRFSGYYATSIFGWHHLPAGMKEIVKAIEHEEARLDNIKNLNSSNVKNILEKLRSVAKRKVNDHYSQWSGWANPRSLKTHQAYKVMYELLNTQKAEVNHTTLETLVKNLNSVACTFEKHVTKKVALPVAERITLNISRKM